MVGFGMVMKEKKEITEQDLQILERHINSTKLQIIDIENQFNSSLTKIKSSIAFVFIISIIVTLLGGYFI
jgi:ferritin-like metal-binding protein YciE